MGSISKVNLILIALIAVIVGGMAGGYFYLRDLRPVTPAPAQPTPQAPLQPITGTGKGQQRGTIKKFKNYAEAAEFISNIGETSGYYFGGLPSMLRSAASLPAVGEMAGASAGMSVADGMGGGTDFSRTNIQVEGVDEGDIVKTDGQYIYAISQNNIQIIKAYPAEESEIVSTIELKSQPSGLYINGDKLAVYGVDASPLILKSEFFRRPDYTQFTFFKVFDISDRKNPKESRDLSFEGYYSNSRLIGDYVYFVTNKSQYISPDDPMPLSYILESGKPINIEREMPVYYFDLPYDSKMFVIVSTVNMNNDAEAPNSESYLLDGNQQMYVSQDNMYIAYTRYVNEYQLMMEIVREIVEPRLLEKTREGIRKIEEADSAVLNKTEKTQKIFAILEQYNNSLGDEEKKSLEEEIENKARQKYEDISKELEKTIINKIAIKDGKIEHKAAGEVVGHVINQFSMDENGGYFRIATTKSPSWSQFSGRDDDASKQSYNNLYILDGDLKVVGKVENLALSERIYSVRFMQGRAYIVTFKQVDPLFVIDVSDPAAPKVLGELKVPGFSNYLHPYNDTTLIGLGNETEENQFGGTVPTGLKISLFDVSDVSNPKETAKYVTEGRWSNSIALYEHKAFLFKKEKNLLVVPVTSYTESTSGSPFNGALAFDIAKDGINLKGKIEHPTKDSPISRSLYIENNLYTLSRLYLGINSLADLSLIKNLELAKPTLNNIMDSMPTIIER